MTGMKRSVPAKTEQMIAALIPTPLPRPRPEPSPLPTLPATRSSGQQAGSAMPTLGIARLDRSGRVSARSLLDQLGWCPGHRVRVDVIDGAILIWPASDGRALVGARGDLALPVAVRQMWCAARRLVVSQRSWEELGGRFLGLMADLDPKGEGDKRCTIG